MHMTYEDMVACYVSLRKYNVLEAGNRYLRGITWNGVAGVKDFATLHHLGGITGKHTTPGVSRAVNYISSCIDTCRGCRGVNYADKPGSQTGSTNAHDGYA